jgi:hypothetical protein
LITHVKIAFAYYVEVLYGKCVYVIGERYTANQNFEIKNPSHSLRLAGEGD